MAFNKRTTDHEDFAQEYGGDDSSSSYTVGVISAAEFSVKRIIVQNVVYWPK